MPRAEKCRNVRPDPSLAVAGAGGVFGADWRLAAQEVEVAALVGLEHVVEEEAAVAARECGRARLPLRRGGGPAPRRAPGASAGGSARPARSRRRPATSASGPPDRGFRRDVQRPRCRRRCRSCARRRCAPCPSRPVCSSLRGIGAAPHSGMPGAPFGPPCLSTSTRGLVDGQVRIVDARVQIARGPRRRPRARGGVSRCGEAADCLSTAPSGQRLPVRIAVPPSFSERHGERADHVGVVQCAPRPRSRPRASCRSRSSASPCSSGSSSSAPRGGRPRRRNPPSGTCPTGRTLSEQRRGARELVEARAAAAARPRGPRGRAGGRSRWWSRRWPCPRGSRCRRPRAVRIWDGLEVLARTISTMRRPDISASARRRESAAGIAALPGSVMPSVSAIAAIVDAVPITMQCPAERERQRLDLAPSPRR